MIYKGYSFIAAHQTDIAVRVGNRQCGFLTRHIEYGFSRRDAIRKALAWIDTRTSPSANADEGA